MADRVFGSQVWWRATAASLARVGAACWPDRLVRLINSVMSRKPAGTLRRGWTTGACAAAAAKAAWTALLAGDLPDPVEIALPRGERPSFALARHWRDGDRATAGIVK